MKKTQQFLLLHFYLGTLPIFLQNMSQYFRKVINFGTKWYFFGNDLAF